MKKHLYTLQFMHSVNLAFKTYRKRSNNTRIYIPLNPEFSNDFSWACLTKETEQFQLVPIVALGMHSSSRFHHPRKKISNFLPELLWPARIFFASFRSPSFSCHREWLSLQGTSTDHLGRSSLAWHSARLEGPLCSGISTFNGVILSP